MKVSSGGQSSSWENGGSGSASPEFEFWVCGNPSATEARFLTADELFSDGIILPLRLLSLSNSVDSATKVIHDIEAEQRPEQTPAQLETKSPSSALVSASAVASKRWKDIFKVIGEKKAGEEKEKEKGKQRKPSGGGGGSMELGIKLWPFSRSRSAGNGDTAARPRATLPPRRVSSAPCSRSNSRGDLQARRWAASPGRARVHIGRSSPVWHVKKAPSSSSSGGRRPNKCNVGKKATTPISGGGTGVTCIGYRGLSNCKVDDKGFVAGNARISGGGGGSLFGLKSLFFSKKVY